MVVTEPTSQELMSALNVAHAGSQRADTDVSAQKSTDMLVMAEVSQSAIGP